MNIQEKERELIKKLNYGNELSEEILENVHNIVSESNKDEIIKDGRINLDNFVVTETIKSPVLSQSSLKNIFSGTDSIFIIKDTIITIIDSFDYFDNKIVIMCPIFFGKDNEYNLLVNSESNTITQLLISEYGTVMERTFENVEFLSEECKHTKDDSVLKNIFHFSSDSPSMFKSLYKKDFIEKYKEFIY